MTSFDLLLACSDGDRRAVGKVARALGRRGLRLAFEEAGSQSFRDTRALVAFVGPGGTPWRSPEGQGRLLEWTLRDVPVIPVLLPGAESSPVPPWLQGAGWLDLRHGVGPQELDRIVWSSSGRPLPSPESLAAVADPPRYNLPLASIGEAFRGREAVLDELARSAGEPTVLVQVPGLVEGVGATRLAVEYAWRFHHCYTALLYARADSVATLAAQLAALGPWLGLERSADLREGAEEVAFWLRDHPGWLLILDDVADGETAEAVEELAGGLAPSGHLLAISRRVRWKEGWRARELGRLGVGAAQRLLLERNAAGRIQASDDAAEARQLVDRCDRLPSVLELASAAVAGRRTSFGAYRKELESQRLRTVLKRRGRTASVFHESFSRISPPGRTLLRLLSFLGPAPIPTALLDEPRELGEALGDLCQETGETPPAWRVRDALLELEATATIRLQAAAAPPGTAVEERIFVHPWIQELVRAGVPAARRPDWVARTLVLVARFAPRRPFEEESWARWELLEPHARSAAAYAEDAGWPRTTARLLNQLGLYLLSRHLGDEAAMLLRRAIRLEVAGRKSNGGDSDAEEHKSRDVDFAARFEGLLDGLKKSGHVEEEAPFLGRWIRIGEQVHGDMETSRRHFEETLAAEQRPRGKATSVERYLGVREHELLDGPYVLAVYLDNLALAFQRSRRVAEAEPFARCALEVAELAFGAGHPNVAVHLNNLGLLLADLNRLQEAEILLRRALRICEEAYEKKDLRLAVRQANLAHVLAADGHLKTAHRLLRRALKTRERSLGKDHPRSVKLRGEVEAVERERQG